MTSTVMSGVPICSPRRGPACPPPRWPGACTARCTASCCDSLTQRACSPRTARGSACRKQLSSETSSTLGEQRLTNYALQPTDEDEFIAAVTEGQPARPQYFEFDARRNRKLRPLLDEATPALLPAAEVLSRCDAGAPMLDAREPNHSTMPALQRISPRKLI